MVRGIACCSGLLLALAWGCGRSSSGYGGAGEFGDAGAGSAGRSAGNSGAANGGGEAGNTGAPEPGGGDGGAASPAGNAGTGGPQATAGGSSGTAGASEGGRSGGAGAGASEGGRSGDAGAGVSGGEAGSAAAGPGWLPQGQFGEDADALAVAASAYTEALCRSGLCLLEAETSDALEQCIEEELRNFAPSLQFVACASRAGDAGRTYLRESAEHWGECADNVERQGCDTAPCPPPATERPAACSSVPPGSHECPGEPEGRYFSPCDGIDDCGDGYDERNCDRSAERYTCADGSSVSWQAICNGADDCPDAIDEYQCGGGGRTSG